MKRVYLSILLLLTFASFNYITAQCASTDPTVPVGIIPTQTTFPGGPPVCDGGYRFDNPTGTHSFDDGFGNKITITVTSTSCGPTFTWTSTGGLVVDKIYVKGGSSNGNGQDFDVNIYDYSATAAKEKTDGNLHSPLNLKNPNIQYFGLSHIDFCYHYELSVSKTAKTSFNRTYEWTITKKCAGPDPLMLSTGQVYDYPFEVTVCSPKYTDSDWKVEGTITVVNNTPFSATITSITDIISPDIAVVPTCGITFPYVLNSGSTLTCTYSAMLPDASSRVNTATVVTSTPKVQGGTATANVTFSSTPTTEIDKCITVSDNGTTLGSVCTDGSTTFCKKFIYTEPVKYDACGDYTYTNTASFVTDDKKVTGSASCSFKVKVPCVGGCTLTQGYWKTHSIYGPAPYDDTWAKIGENTPFFKSGYTYYSIMWVAPAGNAYFILAHQYIAAKLNILNGASTTTDVTAAIAGAEALFNAQGTNDVTFSAQERKSALIYATTLDNYNNGLIGPGHCSESNPKVQPLIAPNNQSQRFDVKETNNLIIYPTPANNEISINLSDYSGEQVDIEIYSTTAQLVLTKKIQEVANHIVPVNVSELAEGAYILSVKSLAHKPASKVLIIQR